MNYVSVYKYSSALKQNKHIYSQIYEFYTSRTFGYDTGDTGYICTTARSKTRLSNGFIFVSALIPCCNVFYPLDTLSLLLL
jgi:hypothetical protein